MSVRKFRLTVLLAVVAVGGIGAQNQPARFRGGVEIVQLDVAVLDNRRQPVPNLTAADFTVLEDGKPQPIVAFQEMSAPDPDGSLVPWMRDVAPDVRTNSADGGRVLVLVLDDVSIAGGNGEVQAVETVKKIGHSFIERMGPLDQACVVFTGDNRLAQDFTNDRQALLKAVDRFHGSAVPAFLRSLYPPQVVGQVAQSLIDVSHRRKAMIYVGNGFRVAADSDAQFGQIGTFGDASGDQRRQVDEARDAIRHAQQANVSIYTINPLGLEAFTDDDARAASNVANDALWSVANATGGFAVTNTNSFTAQLSQIFRETGSYYLLGFRSAYADGKFRRISVTVNRPGVSVRSRNGYYAPAPEKPEKAASPLFKALNGALPDPDLYMRAMAVPFAAADHKTAGVIIALGLAQPGSHERVTEVIDLVSSAFTPEGKSVAQRRQTVRLTLRPSEESEAKFEILTRLDLKPGSYNLRFAMHNQTLGKSGSVYAQVDVPNFEKDSLSLSGVAVHVAQGLPAAANETMAGLVPDSPTTQRAFAAADRVTAFVRVYEGGSKPLLPVAVTPRSKIARDATVFESKTPLEPASFGATREADVSMTLPLASLQPGPYLLTIEAAIDDKTTEKREVRFSIR